MIRCVHVIKSAEPECTGIYKIVRGLAQNSRPHGFDISVLFLEEGPLEEELRRLGIEAHSIPLRNAREYFSNAANVCFWIRRQRAQILHMHWGGRLVRLLGKLGGSDVLIQHVHGRIDEITGKVSDDLHFPGADAVIACSHIVGGSVRQHHTEVVYAGVETDTTPTSLGLRTAPLQVGVLSRLTPIKNIETLLLAARLLRDRKVYIQFTIAGSGYSEMSLRDMASQLGISEDVTFLGWREDVRELLRSWDLLVVTSLDEGLGLAALEAMAVGLPVLASQAGGLPELVIPGLTGELIPPRDPELLASTLERLANDRARLACMGYEGWKRAQQKFSVQAMVRDTAVLYNRLLQRS